MVSAAALLVVLALSAPAWAAGSDVEQVRRSHRLGILTDLSDPNDLTKLFFRSRDGYDGIEYQILISFAQTLGAKAEVKLAKFDSLFGALDRAEGDVVAADLTDTPERRKRADVSDSYFSFRQTVITRSGDPARSYSDLAGRRGITQKGTTWESECLKVPKVKLLYTEGIRDLFSKVADGTADFSVSDSPMAVTYFEKYPGLQIAWSLPEKLNYAFALRKGSDLTPLLNAHLKKLKASGAFYALLARFYGQRGMEILRASESPAGEKTSR